MNDAQRYILAMFSPRIRHTFRRLFLCLFCGLGADKSITLVYLSSAFFTTSSNVRLLLRISASSALGIYGASSLSFSVIIHHPCGLEQLLDAKSIVLICYIHNTSCSSSTCHGRHYINMVLAVWYTGSLQDVCDLGYRNIMCPGRHRRPSASPCAELQQDCLVIVISTSVCRPCSIY